MECDIRAYIRDYYIRAFNKARVIDYMALADYSINFRTYGRIEMIEFLAFGVYTFESSRFKFLDQEEINYYSWLKEQGWKK